MTRRVIAICIEVLGPDRLEDWLAEGAMPNLARIRQEGCRGRLESVADISSGSIWPSFTTGLMPAGHGQFFTHMQLENGSYRVVKKYADDVPAPPFWSGLAAAGKTAAIIDVPQTRPLPGFDGVHVVGWGGEYPAWPRSSQPPALMPEILRRFGPHPLAETRRIAARPTTEAACAQLKADLLQGVRHKAAISRMVLDQGPFDLFLTVFAETHWAMHLLWDTLDPTHAQHDPERARRYASTFPEILGEIDGFIGAARNRHPEADIVVFSLSGMGPNHSGWHLLPEVLTRLGMGPEVAGPVKNASPLRRWGPHALRRLDSMVPAAWIEAVKGLVPDRLWDRWTRRLLYGGAGWQDSRAFWLPNDYSGAIRINLQGREPQGKVAPGDDYRLVCDEIQAALEELVDIQHGRKAVRKVIRTQEICQGPRADDLPDLLVLWADDMKLEAVRSARLGEIRLPSPERRSGAHRNQGFIAAAGPHVASLGTMEHAARVVDLAPSFLELLQLRPAAGIDGQALRWLVGGAGS